MRLRNDPKAVETIQAHPEFFVHNPHELKGQWNFTFPNQWPIHLEIGTGKGQFIIDQALLHPRINFIGIEKNAVICAKVYKKYLASGHMLPNLKIINIDAMELTNIFSQGEIEKIYLNFSDPWPKKRHVKYRLTNHLFLKMYQQILDYQNGIVELKTDNDGFYQWSLESIKSYGANVLYFTNDIYRDMMSQFNKNNIPTEYETKFVNQDKNINKIVFHF